MRSFVLALLMMLSATVPNARGDIVFSIDLDPVTPDVQNVIDVSVGQTITASVSLEVTSTTVNGLGTAVVSILFDSDKLSLGPQTLVVPNPTPPPDTTLSNHRTTLPPGFFSFQGVTTVESGFPQSDPPLSVFFTNTGAFDNIQLLSIPPTRLSPGSKVQFFEFTLRAEQDGLISSNFNDNPSIVVALPGDSPQLMLDGNSNVIPLSQIRNASGPVAVPEPSTVAFLGMGTLLTLRRRAKQRRRNAISRLSQS